MFKIYLTDEAGKQINALLEDKGLSKRYKAVKKTLSLLKSNPRHPSLKTHEHSRLSRVAGIKVFEAYAEQNTPAAYRIFWYYGPQRNEITIISITAHP